MLDEKKSTLRFGDLSLLPLSLALTEAEKESPSRAPRRPKDPDEELARQLVEKMRKEYKRSRPFVGCGLLLQRPRV